MGRSTLIAALAVLIAALAVAGAAASESRYADTIRADSPSVHYRMADMGLPTITTLFDSGPFSIHGNYRAGGITQGVTPSPVATDASDFAVTSDGGGEVARVLRADLEIGGQKLPLANTERTVEAWYLSSQLGRQSIVGWGAGPAGGHFAMHVDRDALIVDVLGGEAIFRWQNPSQPALGIQDGSWHHLAITYKPGAAPKYAAYVDGTPLLLSTVKDAAASDLVTEAGDLVIGTSTFCCPPPLLGSIDEVAVYKSALSSEAIKSHYEVAGGTDCPGATVGQSSTCVAVDVLSQITVTAPPTVNFGQVFAGQTKERFSPVFVEMNGDSGYQLSVTRTAFTGGDLPLGIRSNNCANPLGGECTETPPSFPSADLELDLDYVTPTPITIGSPFTSIGRRKAGTVAPAQGDQWPTVLALEVPAGTAAGRHSSVVTYSAVVLP